VTAAVSSRFIPRRLVRGLAAIALALTGVALVAAERIPPAPAKYFNDYAGIVSSQTAGELNTELENYERESSDQLLVAIYPKMESDSSVEDYTVRVAQAWKAGQPGKKNGAVLFAFMQEHQLRIQVGYGLEATLTDALSKQIIENELKPAFRSGDYDKGLRSAVLAMIAATKGEYKGSGRTVGDQRPSISPHAIWVIIVILFVLFSWIRSFRRSVVYGGRRTGGLGGIFWAGSGGGGSWSGGGGGGGGGGFSGGGGSFGGGGAGGSW
jgi:uncharacterized protein